MGQNFYSFMPLSVSIWIDLADPVFDVVRVADLKSKADVFLLASATRSIFVFSCFSRSRLSFYRLVYCDLWGWVLWTDMV